MTGNEVIRTENLTKRYRRNRALRDVTLEVPEGSVFALVGPNGAGKSTAIKIVMNILQPSAGRAEILGVDSRALRAEQLAQIGYVSENQYLPEWMKAGYFFDYCKAFYPTWNDADLAALVRAYDLPLDRPLELGTRRGHFAGPNWTWLSTLNRAETFFPTADSGTRGFKFGLDVPLESLDKAKIGVTPEIVTGYTEVYFDLPGISLANYRVRPQSER